MMEQVAEHGQEIGIYTRLVGVMRGQDPVDFGFRDGPHRVNNGRLGRGFLSLDRVL